MVRYILLSVLLVLVIAITGCAAGGAKNGDSVYVHYTGRLADGTVFDSSVDGEPLGFTLGNEEMIPGFENAVLGMKVSEKKTVNIAAKDAYGPRDETMTAEIGRDKLPAGMVPEEGQQLQMRSPNGATMVVTITNVTETTITIDGNHPLAGKDLTFELELVDIE